LLGLLYYNEEQTSRNAAVSKDEELSQGVVDQ